MCQSFFFNKVVDLKPETLKPGFGTSVFLWISRNSYEHFFYNSIKKETLAHVFSCKFCKISKNSFFTEDLRTTASAPQSSWFLGFRINSCLMVPGKRRNADSTQWKYYLAKVGNKSLAFPKLTYSFYLILRMLRALCPTLYLEMYVSGPGCLLVINTTTEICLFPRNLFKEELNVLRENIKKDWPNMLKTHFLFVFSRESSDVKRTDIVNLLSRLFLNLFVLKCPRLTESSFASI